MANCIGQSNCEGDQIGKCDLSLEVVRSENEQIVRWLRNCLASVGILQKKPRTILLAEFRQWIVNRNELMARYCICNHILLYYFTVVIVYVTVVWPLGKEAKQPITPKGNLENPSSGVLHVLTIIIHNL